MIFRDLSRLELRIGCNLLQRRQRLGTQLRVTRGLGLIRVAIAPVTVYVYLPYLPTGVIDFAVEQNRLIGKLMLPSDGYVFHRLGCETIESSKV